MTTACSGRRYAPPLMLSVRQILEGKMTFPWLRECVFYGIAVALAAPPVLALADAAGRGRWFVDGVSGSLLVALPFLLVGAAFLGAPVSVPTGALGGLALSWWAGQSRSGSNLHRDGAVLGAVMATGMLAALSLIDGNVWGADSAASWLFPIVGGVCLLAGDSGGVSSGLAYRYCLTYA